MTFQITPIAISGLSIRTVPPFYPSPVIFYFSMNLTNAFTFLMGALDIGILFNGFVQLEAQYFGKPSQVSLREAVAARPGCNIPGSSTRSFEDLRIGVSGSRDFMSDNQRSTFLRQVPLALLFWIPCLLIACHPNRDMLLSVVNSGTNIPFILTQLLSKIRTAENTRVKVEVVLPKNPASIISKFKDTFFDTLFLFSGTGITAYFAFCDFVASNPDNYIKFDVLTDSNRSKLLPRLHAGEQITFCAFNSQDMNINGTALQGNVEIRNINSLPPVIKAAHFHDAFLTQARLHFDAALSNYVPQTQELFAQRVEIGSSDNFYRYIISRCDGSIINYSYIDGDIPPSRISKTQPIKGKSIKKESIKEDSNKTQPNKTDDNKLTM